ncbi:MULTISPECIES: hypothetical protein [unclassified Saccharothrix]|uniref:hypothetical protein n=1 Tax=unclassified Saccharothrix TaxID=2593673 RepID=UPI00307D80B5
MASSLHTTLGVFGAAWWKMFHACKEPEGVRCSNGVNPSPPVAVTAACTGGVSCDASTVPPGRAAALVARTATVPDAGSASWKVVPSVDHCGVHPGGTRSEPGA